MIDFTELQEVLIPNARNGEGDTIACIYTDATVKIMKITLKSGCSIGMHTHEKNSEIAYIISGQARCVIDGKEEIINQGQCHYCPKGSTHMAANNGDEDLVIFAVVHEQ